MLCFPLSNSAQIGFKGLAKGVSVNPELGRVKVALWRALHEDVTEKQRRYMLLYYAEGLNMNEIGEREGVDKSTVSRTIRRGEERLRRCLRYGAKRFLLDEGV